jgi:hypothetical protein
MQSPGRTLPPRMLLTHWPRSASWAILATLLIACSPRVESPPSRTVPSAIAVAETLPSWNDGPARTAILEFVKAVTAEGSADFVPPPQRIATFDNDGTL